ncbi:hypothetical protein DMC30DRAFT_148760 [Rhodotorula diobovata]|uniref:Secreted protein n=1 Tax=Rhodotorula diobovata TaxID=5288 RepID=A0A5C5FZX3_9BASI|nr:hypothetical protein DMC30DRAFT_148760 [Rhodotorula diobovata]
MRPVCLQLIGAAFLPMCMRSPLVGTQVDTSAETAPRFCEGDDQFVPRLDPSVVVEVPHLHPKFGPLTSSPLLSSPLLLTNLAHNGHLLWILPLRTVQDHCQRPQGRQCVPVPLHLESSVISGKECGGRGGT